MLKAGVKSASSLVAMTRVRVQFKTLSFLFVLIVFTWLLYLHNVSRIGLFRHLMTPNSNETRHVESFEWSLVNNSDDESSDECLICTSGCQILDMDPFDDETVYYYTNLTGQSFNCGGYYNTSVRVTRVNGSRFEVESDDEVYCFAKGLIRITDRKYKFGKELPLEKFYNRSYNAAKVRCYDTPDKDNIVFNKTFPLVPTKIKSVEVNQTDDDEEDGEEVDKSEVPSVLLLGIDSLSRLNFERYFVKTKKLLKKKKFFQLYGYNKVGLNTFPNMVPFYTGHHPEELGFYNSSQFHSHFDDWPFIWKEFKKLGHVTMSAEVWPEAGAFHYFKPGFKNDPVDVNLRMWALASSKDVWEAKDSTHRTWRYCLGEKKEIDVYYDYTFDFIEEMHRRKKKYFATVFMGRMTHDSLKNAHYIDRPVYSLLKRLFKHKMLNNTFVMLFSDHSLRYGYLIWNTLKGKIEARLPMHHIYIPEGFPLDTSKLIKNQHKLTTHFDSHATLMHIAKLESPGRTLPHGISLFDEIPDNRTCPDAGIPSQICSCGDFREIEDEDTQFLVSEKVLEGVNKIIEDSNMTSLCSQFKLDKTTSIYAHTFKVSNGTSTLIKVTIETKPGQAQFEATMRLQLSDQDVSDLSNNKTIRIDKKQLEIDGEIVRVNSYGKQADCITTKVTENGSFIKNYCYCKK